MKILVDLWSDAVSYANSYFLLADNVGRMVLGGAAGAGIGALCFYGLGLSNDVGAIDKARYELILSRCILCYCFSFNLFW